MEPHVILRLQVPGLLAQEAKDIGEVLVANLAKHLRGEPDRNHLLNRTDLVPSSLISVTMAQGGCPAVATKARRKLSWYQTAAVKCLLCALGYALNGRGPPAVASASPRRAGAHSFLGAEPLGKCPVSAPTLTLSSALSSSFRLLSEDVTSGPKSTLPWRAEGTVMRSWDEAFLLLPFPELPVNVLPTILFGSRQLPQAWVSPSSPAPCGRPQEPLRTTSLLPRRHLPHLMRKVSSTSPS